MWRIKTELLDLSGLMCSFYTEMMDVWPMISSNIEITCSWSRVIDWFVAHAFIDWSPTHYRSTPTPYRLILPRDIGMCSSWLWNVNLVTSEFTRGFGICMRDRNLYNNAHVRARCIHYVIDDIIYHVIVGVIVDLMMIVKFNFVYYVLRLLKAFVILIRIFDISGI